MSNYNVRNNFKDIFGVYLLESLSFDGEYDMPIIGCSDDITAIDYLALYKDKSEYSKTKNTAVCFYQFDHIFDGIHGLYNSIIYHDEKRLNKFRERFKNAKWIITPDYSLFGDFPNALQIFNVYKSRVCAAWLMKNTQAKIIPNVRWTHPFSYEYCFDGIIGKSNVAVGILGQMQAKDNRKMFQKGFKEMVDRLSPKSIVAYGFVSETNFDEYFGYAVSRGTKIVVPHSKIDRYKKEDAIYGVR